MKIQTTLIAALAALLLGIGTGWELRTWYDAHAELEHRIAMEKESASIAAKTVKTLAEDRAEAESNNERARDAITKNPLPACKLTDDRLRLLRR